MTYSVVLTKEQEQRRNEAKQALDSLKYNPLCYNCKKFCAGCAGTTCKTWTGCVEREYNGGASLSILALYVPELIKNDDFFSYDGFLEDLRDSREGVINWLEARTRGEHLKNEVLTEKYIEACKKILKILKEA